MNNDQFEIEELIRKAKISNDADAVNSVAIIGAGIMGQGIAQTIAAAGIEVLVIEKDSDHLETGKNRLSEDIDREIKRWAITTSEKKAIFGRIKWSLNLSDAADCELIIEA
ncbi:MAG: 3-hydroxybutyryl-CoA dehydrogenase, partial [Ignavibacteria bacterium CG08_land_8_20_14_0_20_37_9]